MHCGSTLLHCFIRTGSIFQELDLEYDPEECILRREVYASGKSRAFINDSPASLNQMKALGEKLIDVHSQHQNLLLNKEGFQLNILDILAQDEKQLEAYKQVYRHYKDISNTLEELIIQAEKSRQDEDYLRFQLEQLEEASLHSGEQTELEQEAETLSHTEEIKANLYKAQQLIDGTEANGILSQTKDCQQALQNISNVYPSASEWVERLRSCYIELKDIAHDLSVAEEETEFNPERLDYVSERLNLIYNLQQKHRVTTIEALLELAKITAIN